jgi:virginiamycin A acetyltransferase
MKMLLGEVIFRLYRLRHRRLRRFLMNAVLRVEGGDMRSPTARRISSAYHGVEIGLYSDCTLTIFNHMGRGTVVGRYCSIASGARTYTCATPPGFLSNHDLFCDPALGVVKQDPRPPGRLTIGHDVWLGQNAVVLPTVSSIGVGAFVGANSVVAKDVPPYAIVAGNPARVTRYRFSPPVIERLLASRWWESPIEELLPDIARFQRPVEEAAEVGSVPDAPPPVPASREL